jgi:multidrug efflux pump subunit AcrB
VLVLAAAFERRALALVVLVNVPFSLIGAILALAATAQSLSLGALVGLVTVFGISARNAILLLAHYEKLLEESPTPPGRPNSSSGVRLSGSCPWS